MYVCVHVRAHTRVCVRITYNTCSESYSNSFPINIYDSHIHTLPPPTTTHLPLLAAVMLPNIVQGHRERHHTREDEEPSHEIGQGQARQHIEPPELNTKYGSDHIRNGDSLQENEGDTVLWGGYLPVSHWTVQTVCTKMFTVFNVHGV